ncbi:hypothetical protein RI367_001705 [Sorochytrium milnesiophthora]
MAETVFRWPEELSVTPDIVPLSKEQAAQQQQLEERIRSSFTDLTDPELQWLSVDCYARYLRACNWDLAAAGNMLEASLKWRREYKPEALDLESVRPESVTGKIVINGFDSSGHPVLYLRPRYENTSEAKQQVQFVVLSLETIIRIMPAGIEKLVLVIDFRGASKGKSPGLSMQREILHILSNYYPERLYRAILINPPWFFWLAFKIIRPLINPVTRAKVVFVDMSKDNGSSSSLALEEGEETAAAEQEMKEEQRGGTEVLRRVVGQRHLPVEYGGRVEWQFDAEEYWSRIQHVWQG